MTIRTIKQETELQIVLNWAAEEGWNPGLDDAAPFFAADREGFFVKVIDDVPVAAISVVNHDPDFAFLGLYLCKPAFRGQGHGIALWRAGIAHAGTRCIGLDGVPEQQANYARSGFVKSDSTVRYEGYIERKDCPEARVATEVDLPFLVSWDQKASGVQRRSFSMAWMTNTETRKTVVLARGSQIEGFATYRRCLSGAKIGPFHASSETDAMMLLASNPFSDRQGPMIVDVQMTNPALAMLLEKHGFVEGFETARMFAGVPPTQETSVYQAIATMELG